jgi:N-acetyl-beta-hexosaminidase
VIVELDMPGHISAWSLGLNDSLFIDCAKANSGDYNGVTKVLDLASPDALAAMVSVVDDAAKRFPSSHVHLGGDEVDLRCVNASASAQVGSSRKAATRRSRTSTSTSSGGSTPR